MLGTDGTDGGAAISAILDEVSKASRGFIPIEGGGNASAAYIARVDECGSRNLLAVFNFGSMPGHAAPSPPHSITLNMTRLGLRSCQQVAARARAVDTATRWICADVWNSSAAAAVTMHDDGYLVVPVDVLSSRLLRCICSPGVAN